MTTNIKVSVPEGVNYRVSVKSENKTVVGDQVNWEEDSRVDWIDAGASWEGVIYDTKRVVIEEVKLESETPT